MNTRFTRRAAMHAIGASAAALPMSSALSGQVLNAPAQPQGAPPKGPTTSTPEDRERRLKWWHEARFGMFIHWGLYSVYGRHEWVMENEGIPVAEYEQAAKRFNPVPNAARAWAQLARRAGMKYMVMTTKHHEGFCHFDSKLTNYTAMSACGRDLVREYVNAARAEGMRVGFYYSLMDWHHPDGALCAVDENARRRFVDYIHGQVRELCSNYGKIDILWYDVNWPLKPEGWEAVKLNTMVRQLQPDILLNNRTGIPEDFTTPEQVIRASDEPWESCMTMNDSWGYHHADDNWKTPKNIVRNLVRCTRDNGNYLLNIGPQADGTIPIESVNILTEVGRWMDTHAELIHMPVDPCKVNRSQLCDFLVRGNKLYVMVQFWPGSELSLGGMKTKAVSAKLYGASTPVRFEQSDLRLRFIGLPETPHDPMVSVIEVEFDAPPAQDAMLVRRNRSRRMVGI
ncbi:MAG TPA: alpha-L-fucosidase [Bryobacteraceae bacterium]|nr:alpha-L-fucosidase [Bryobacteraceae bacterium]